MLLIMAVTIPGATSGQAKSVGGMQAPGKQEQAKQEPARPKSKPKRYRLWIRIGRCEQPGRQMPGRINWSHPGPTYGGGLGIYLGTWRAFRPKGFPNTPGAASWRQQMAVANRIFSRYGSSAWGCG